MSLIEHFFKGLNLYLEADPYLGDKSDPRLGQDPDLHQIKIRMRIRIKVMRIHNTAYPLCLC
jgi:hypothetical protein